MVQKSPKIYNAALLAFWSDNPLIISTFNLLINSSALPLYFLIKSRETIILSQIASSLLLSIIFPKDSTHISKLFSNLYPTQPIYFTLL